MTSACRRLAGLDVAVMLDIDGAAEQGPPVAVVALDVGKRGRVSRAKSAIRGFTGRMRMRAVARACRA